MPQIICVAQEEEGGERGMINTEHVKYAEASYSFYIRAQLCSRCPAFRGTVIPLLIDATPSRAAVACSWKSFLPRRAANPHAHAATGRCIFYSCCCFSPPVGLILWVSTAAVGIWGECTAFLQALLSALGGSGRWHKPCFPLCPCLLGLSLITRQKKSWFLLSVLLLQIRLVSTCLLGRGDLCSKLCGCRLWRNNNIVYNLTYNIIHPSLLLQKALRSCF